jgi:hypothetical protein
MCGGIYLSIVNDIYEYKKEKIKKEHTVNGKLSSRGVWKLFALAEKYGKTKEEYFPDDYGTDDYFRNR